MTTLKAGLAAAPVMMIVMVMVSTAPASAAMRFIERDAAAADGATRHVLVRGEIADNDDLRAFERAVRHNRASAVTFDSPGGSINKAMELGRLIRRLGLDTFQTDGGRCYSACSLAFMGGVVRTAVAGSVGMHQSRIRIPDLDPDVAMARIQRLVAEKIVYLDEMGIDPGVLQLAYRAATDDMHYLTAAELRRYRLVTPRDGDEPLAAEAGPAAEEPLLPRDRPFWAIIQQQAFLHEEAAEGAPATAGEGRVFWSLSREALQDGLPPEPVIRADIEFPERGLSARLTLRRNTTDALAASHLIDILFATADDFAGEGIAAVRTPALKATEAEAGEALQAAPERITDSYYLIALDAAGEAVESNLDLLRERAWIDLPVTYASGRRALLTLEKGPIGAEVFEQAMLAWAEVEVAEVTEAVE